MSQEDRYDTPPGTAARVVLLEGEQERGQAGVPGLPARASAGLTPGPLRRRRRLRKLRFLAIVLAGLLLGLISFLYGLFMAVTSDLPRLDDRYQFTHAKNSVLLDDQGRPLGVLSEQHRILLSAPQIPRIVKEAVVAIEDKRFYSEPGIDPKGIARAAVSDLFNQRGVQGASTIAEQFVKNALEAQSHRTVFEKLREAALAFQLTHKWSKEKILTEYLNTIYFGEGAYGVESAAETYFGHEASRLGCGLPKAPLCVGGLGPAEAALLAGIIAAPSAFDPVSHPQAAKARRDVVLKDMLEQHYLTEAQYQAAIVKPLPASETVQAPHVPPVDGLQTGYFTTWVEQQLIERYSAQRALEGGLTIHTTLDLDLQRAAEAAVRNYLSGPEGPAASLVAIENTTGDVRAMVGGRDYDASPFNLATQGERQPGSAFKPFDLAAALQYGISPYSVWTSSPKALPVPGTDGRDKFYVHNDENAYAGSRSLIDATAYSDNSVFAEVGMDVGTGRVADMARRMGIRTPVSTNPAMTIGGLSVGVTPIDMAHAYETIAQGGLRIGSSLISDGEPTGIQEVDAQPGQVLNDGLAKDVNQVAATRVLPSSVASTETSMLETVLEYGTARRAAIGQYAAGKTGTTSNFGDAWFVGWDDKYTVAVWVGYPDRLIPMTTEYAGGPVEGGTFPALIWHDFMLAAIQVEHERGERTERVSGRSGLPNSAEEALPGPGGPAPGGSNSPAPSGGGNEGGAKRGHPSLQRPAPSPNNEGAEGSAGTRAGGPPPTGPNPSTPAPAPASPPPRESSASSGAGAGGGGGSNEGAAQNGGGGGGAASPGGGTPSAGGGGAPPGG